jgi:hypothetical protein
VIDANAMAGTINSSTAPAKGAMSATRKMADRLRQPPRAANWIGVTRQIWARSSSNLHSSPVVGQNQARSSVNQIDASGQPD